MKLRNKVIGLAAVIAAMMLGGCGNIADSVNNELTKEYVPSDEVIIHENGVGKKAEDVLPEGFELALSNDYLELYIGEKYDVAVYEKASGTVTYSNPAYYELTEEEQNKISSEMKKTVFSQVSLEYYNTAQSKLTMSSYPDAYSNDKNQVKWEVNDDVLTVTYGIGINLKDSVIVQIFTKETFESYITILEGMVETKEISTIDLRNFKNMYTEYTYETMSKEEQEKYIGMYPKLPDLGTIYVIKNKITTKQTAQLLEIYTLLGIDASVKVAEDEKLGEVLTSSNPAWFSIPLEYRLKDNDLLVSVDLENIQTTEGYNLTQVSFLKDFGATRATDAGYVFIPDGSGSIIENDIAANSMDNIMIPFYGEDDAKAMTEGTSAAIDNVFPVWGLKKNDNSVFAIVENGAAIGGVKAQAHSSYLPYNIAYPYFNYQVVDSFGIEGVSLAFYDNIPDTEFVVRYHFLHEDEATYSGMARYYRTYLEKSGAFANAKKEADELKLNVEVIGSVKKTINYFGIPIDTDYSITTFDEAEEIMKLLREGGVTNSELLYTGITNGGMEHKAYGKLKFQKVLGGLDGFKSLAGSLSGNGTDVYAGIDFTKIYDEGYGITDTEDVSKYLTRSSVIAGGIKEDGVITGGLFNWLVNPLRYAGITEKFISAYESVGSKTLYVESLGSHLNANYSRTDGVTRYSSQILAEEMLTALKDNGYAMKFDVGNDYVLKYADSLVNVPTDSSNQRIESYSIPFVGMVFKGYIPYTSGSINLSANSETAVLQAIESGAGLHYLLVYEEQMNMQDTNFDQLFAVNYEIHLQDILANYKNLNEQMGHLANVKIAEHEHLSEDVNLVIYEDGTKIYVNYGKEDFTAADGVVKAGSFLVKGR
ncbi:MAG: hypothetical protein J6B39_08110 [Lachnospiraceae bacterium]|nr:hypothetical protein [Lachnospiraceae bacterium]